MKHPMDYYGDGYGDGAENPYLRLGDGPGQGLQTPSIAAHISYGGSALAAFNMDVGKEMLRYIQQDVTSTFQMYKRMLRPAT